jgi:hypothetical protein
LWKLNIAVLVINLVVIAAYSIIILHQNFRDVSFHIDMLLDSDKFPFSYQLVLTKLA